MGKAFNACQPLDQHVVVVPRGLAFGVQSCDQQRHFRARWYMHLRAGGADVVDQVDHPVHLAVGVGIHQISGGVGWPIGVDQHLFAVVGQLPQLFCDERHDGVQQDQTLVQHPAQGLLCLSLRPCIIPLQDRFGEFQIPVADVAPCKGIKRIGGVVEAICLHCCIDCFAHLAGFANDPFVQRLGGFRPYWIAGIGDFIMLGEAERVPKLRAEVAVALDPIL